MEAFERFWTHYPKRRGANPKIAARQKFLRAVTNGADPERIICGAKAYAREIEEQKKVGSEFVAYASTWLNQQRWVDYGDEQIKILEIVPKQFIEVQTPQWEAWSKLKRWPQTDHKVDGRIRRGWFFESEWPGR